MACAMRRHEEVLNKQLGSGVLSFANMSVDGHFYDGIFDDGVFTEQRIDAACVRLMELAQSDEREANKAARLLKDMLLLAIADGRVVDPEGCASHYFTVVEAALGEPTLLDKVKAWQEKRKRSS
jgi:hypothetical protein